ncbi:lipocalin-like domain-containing protein [Fulvivirga ligni]|uniref:lipocalin-like domain-containing protein n=1 Tax=Fulvivirga ligni TaxID=2904246 RepID=UPI001F47E870|nr:lipocalin-like domain-containing protein [Fulvivirga ligni]UII23299.1 lipocalin-like domain-containing protein [Fulvivirga ligni]
METTVNNLTKKIVGTWKLVSWYYQDEDGNRVDYFGRNPQGILIYDNAGYMSVHIMKNSRTKFKTDGMYEGTPEEIESAFKSYFAYYGKYYQDDEGTMTHIVEGGLFPNWEGNVEKRYAKIEDNQLIIYTPPIPTENGDIVFYVVWERCKE